MPVNEMIIPFAVSIESYDLFQKTHKRITYYTLSAWKADGECQN